MALSNYLGQSLCKLIKAKVFNQFVNGDVVRCAFALNFKQVCSEDISRTRKLRYGYTLWHIALRF